MPSYTWNHTDTTEDIELNERCYRKARRSPTTAARTHRPIQRPPRTDRDQAFKCIHCKQFIGVPLTGGRHRNHCPNCLHSRHVDDTYPGDRKSACRATMEPIGILTRRNGEQVIVHRCKGCGKEDPNRIAADDNPVLLMRLKPIRHNVLAVVDAAESESPAEEKPA